MTPPSMKEADSDFMVLYRARVNNPNTAGVRKRSMGLLHFTTHASFPSMAGFTSELPLVFIMRDLASCYVSWRSDRPPTDRLLYPPFPLADAHLIEPVLPPPKMAAVSTYSTLRAAWRCLDSVPQLPQGNPEALRGVYI